MSPEDGGYDRPFWWSRYWGRAVSPLCVCVYVSGQSRLSQMTFDLHIWHAGSPWPCVRSKSWIVVHIRNRKVFLSGYGCTLWCDVFVLLFVRFFVLKWSTWPPVTAFWHCCNFTIGWLEFNIPCQHKYGYIRDEIWLLNNNYNHLIAIIQVNLR